MHFRETVTIGERTVVREVVWQDEDVLVDSMATQMWLEARVREFFGRVAAHQEPTP